jgi:tRNA G18 (ribose-2'-O)-methylase SpoU
VSKKKNLGTLIRSGSAFNMSKIFLISRNPEEKKKSKVFKEFQFFGD